MIRLLNIEDQRSFPIVFLGVTFFCIQILVPSGIELTYFLKNTVLFFFFLCTINKTCTMRKQIWCIHFFFFFFLNSVGCLNSRFSNLLFYSMFALEMTSYAPTISLRTKTLRMIGQILLALQYATYLILFSLSEYHSQKCSWTSGRSNGRQEPLNCHCEGLLVSSKSKSD